RCEGLEIQLSFVLLLAMTGHAILRQKRLDDRFESALGGRGQYRRMLRRSGRPCACGGRLLGLLSKAENRRQDEQPADEQRTHVLELSRGPARKIKDIHLASARPLDLGRSRALR